jgi:hypothetical protein
MMKGRYTADVSLLDDEIVMFLIGMRIDKAPQRAHSRDRYRASDDRDGYG